MGVIQCNFHGESSIAINIQKDICLSILHQEELFDNDLEVVKVKVYDAGVLLMDVNYLLTRKNKLHLDLGDENGIDANDQKIDVLNGMTGAICARCLDEYKYIENISETMRKFRQ